jgi:hypothetical protein
MEFSAAITGKVFRLGGGLILRVIFIILAKTSCISQRMGAKGDSYIE